ncbi:MAG: N-acetylmuramoyl-L-alanine amidase [Clostridia bacterium]|nr:N-acetylmuramoyl-L-alanine amidase [Clostridia bacterium]
MKIYVINLIGKRLRNALIALILIVVVILATTTKLLTNSVLDIIPTQSVDNIPYERLIILDAGHGGEDSGAVGVNGVLEKDLNLQIAFEIGAELEKQGYIVVYTRTDDRLLYNEDENIKGIRKISDLKNRCIVAQRYPDSIFVSIHMNSFGSSKYSGLQVYYGDKDKNSEILAGSIQDSVSKDLQKDNNRKIKPGDGMYILENVSNTAVLIECGFLTNSAECKKLSEKEYQKELSFAIVCGIIEYKDKSSEK